MNRSMAIFVLTLILSLSIITFLTLILLNDVFYYSQVVTNCSVTTTIQPTFDYENSYEIILN